MKLKNVEIRNCGGGIQSNVKIEADGLTISGCGSGIHLTGDGSRSHFDNLTISDCVDAIIVEVVSTDMSEPPESVRAELEAILGSIRETTSPEVASEAVRSSGFGRWLKAQGFTDWANLGVNIARLLNGS